MIESSAWNVDQRWHAHKRDYVFPDGVTLGDVVDAIAAAGLAANYVLASELKIRYALDVCTRCAVRMNEDRDFMVKRSTLLQYGIDAFGTICAKCELEFIAAGREKREL